MRPCVHNRVTINRFALSVDGTNVDRNDQPDILERGKLTKMITRTRFVLTLATMFIVCMHGSSVIAAEPARPLTGKAWLDMDYGPYLTTTVEAAEPAGNFAYKGIVIRVGEKKEQTIVFDTDTLRYAVGLSDGGIAMTGIVFDGKHWAYPKTEGTTAMSNVVGPGWGKPGATAESMFADPRFRGRDGKPYGPMPRDWARWKGLYLHQDQVVLSYTVGKANVLELPGGEMLGDQPTLTRSLDIHHADQPLNLRISTKAPGQLTKGQTGAVSWLVQKFEQQKTKTTPKADMAVLIACLPADDNTAVLSATDSDVLLTLTPAKNRATAKVILWRGEAAKLDSVLAALKNVKPAAELTSMTKGGPPRWTEKPTTKATIGKAAKGSPWAVDEITLPSKNPWNSWMRLGGFDFFKDGNRAAICTWSGDVWIVSGIKPGDELGELSWQRIATGMFQPLGLRIVDEHIYVSCRDQITRLIDLNGDGETDFYENFNNDHQVTEHFHEFAMGLQTDEAGNFYYAKSGQHARDSLVEQHGTLMKVSKDGKTSEILANGYRAANGVGLGPGGTFFTSDQEGFWMPANRINLVQQGSFSGNMFSYHRGDVPSDYDRPIVWLPKGFDRSPAEQVWVRDERWGLPKDSIISLSYGTGQILSVIYEPIKNVKHVTAQGAAFRLGLQFPTGIMRGRFHPADGQLYACGLFGWSSDRTSPGGFWRVRHTGAKVHVPVAYHIVHDGIDLTFSHPLDPETANDVDSYAIEQWDYKWTKNYGSPEFKLSDGTKGRDTIEVASAKLSKDGRTVRLNIADLKPSMQIRIQYTLDAADGSEIKQDLFGSIFVVPKAEQAASK